MSDILIEIKKAVINGEHTIVKEKVEAALNQGLNPEEILNIALVEAMTEVGRTFELGDEPLELALLLVSLLCGRAQLARRRGGFVHERRIGLSNCNHDVLLPVHDPIRCDSSSAPTMAESLYAFVEM